MNYLYHVERQVPGHGGAKIMKILRENSLSDFEFWNGAEDFAARLTDEELSAIEAVIEDLYPDGIGETELNDLFWFEPETRRGVNYACNIHRYHSHRPAGYRFRHDTDNKRAFLTHAAQRSKPFTPGADFRGADY